MKVAITLQDGSIKQTIAYASADGDVFVQPTQVLKQAGVPKGSVGRLMKKAMEDGVIQDDNVFTGKEMQEAGFLEVNVNGKYVTYEDLQKILKIVPNRQKPQGIELVGARVMNESLPYDTADINVVFPDGAPPERARELHAEMQARLNDCTGIRVQLTDFQEDRIVFDATFEKTAEGLMPRTADIERELGVTPGKLASIARNAYINGQLIHGHHLQFVGPNQNKTRLTPSGFRALMKMRATKRALGTREPRMTLV